MSVDVTKTEVCELKSINTYYGIGKWSKSHLRKWNFFCIINLNTGLCKRQKPKDMSSKQLFRFTALKYTIASSREGAWKWAYAII